MSEKDINRWHETVTPSSRATQPWTVKSGGSWDMLDVAPIPDAMLAELAQRYHYAGTPWNCHSMPLTAGDREYMYLLYFSMQGLVARMRALEKRLAGVVDVMERCESNVDDCYRASDSEWATQLAAAQRALKGDFAEFAKKGATE